MLLRPTHTAAALFVAVGAVLTGCSSDDGGQTAAELPSTATELSLGQTHDAGQMQVTVSEPRKFTSSAQASPQPNAPAFAVDVTLKNTGTDEFEVVGLMVKTDLGGSPPAAVFDHANGVAGDAAAKDVPAGGEETISYGYVAAKPGPVTVIVEGATDKPITFTGAL